MLIDQIPETEPLVQLPNQDQTAVRGKARSLEIDFQQPIETELERLGFFFTHRVLTSLAS